MAKKEEEMRFFWLTNMKWAKSSTCCCHLLLPKIPSFMMPLVERLIVLSSLLRCCLGIVFYIVPQYLAYSFHAWPFSRRSARFKSFHLLIECHNFPQQEKLTLASFAEIESSGQVQAAGTKPDGSVGLPTGRRFHPNVRLEVEIANVHGHAAGGQRSLGGAGRAGGTRSGAVGEGHDGGGCREGKYEGGNGELHG